jgi:hypothetical protein
MMLYRRHRQGVEDVPPVRPHEQQHSTIAAAVKAFLSEDAKCGRSRRFCRRQGVDSGSAQRERPEKYTKVQADSKYTKEKP